MTDPVTLVVYGRPTPKGSMRHVGRGILVDALAGTAPWRGAITAEALRQPVRDLDGPLEVRV